jgi:hypothetical protein
MESARLGKCLCVAIGLFAGAGTGFAEGIDRSRDHRLVGRYEGSSIVSYRHADSDEAVLLQAPHDYTALLDKHGVPTIIAQARNESSSKGEQDHVLFADSV